MDISMPDLNGLEAALERSAKSLPKTEILILHASFFRPVGSGNR